MYFKNISNRDLNIPGPRGQSCFVPKRGVLIGEFWQRYVSIGYLAPCEAVPNPIRYAGWDTPIKVEERKRKATPSSSTVAPTQKAEVKVETKEPEPVKVVEPEPVKMVEPEKQDIVEHKDLDKMNKTALKELAEKLGIPVGEWDTKADIKKAIEGKL